MPAVVDNPGQVVMDSEEEILKKKNKRVAKRKEQLAKLCILVGCLLSPFPKLFPLLLSRSVLAPMLALMTIPIFYPGSFAVLLSRYMLAPNSHLGSLAISLSRCLSASISCSRSPVVSSS